LLIRKLKNRCRINSFVQGEDGSDHHRISKEDLEKIYTVATKNPFNLLFFMTMLTTGMRIGGYVKIKCLDIATQNPKDGTWKAKAQGSTLEKNCKKFTFLIQATVRKLMEHWLNHQRPVDPSPYLFPGRTGEHLTTGTIRDRFQDMCRLAGLQGQQFHPHALRHCYSHILLELGNSADVVSKLINHSSVKTTEKYYLKESAVQVTDRAIIPWMKRGKKQKENPVPSFLMGEDGKQKKRKLNSLRLFNTTMST
jgi:integrase